MYKWLGWWLALTVSSVAVAGPGGSGGGDPQAVEFLMLADQVATWLKTTKTLPNVDANAFQRQTDRLRRSLDAPYAAPFLIFSDEPVKCDIGGRKISKVACTVDGEVTVYRNVWMLSTEAQKFELVSQEVFILMGIEANRYSMAQVIGEHAPEIGVKPINPGGGITITSVTGASAVSTLGEANTPVTIYAGFAGANCGNDPTATCNSCISCGDTLCVCNTRRLNNNSVVTISFVSDSTDDTKFVTITNASNIPTIMGGRYLGAGTTNTITTTWGQLCTLALTTSGGTMGSNCDAGFPINAPIYIGLTDGTTMYDHAVLHVMALNPTAATIDDCSGSNDEGAGAICNFKMEAGNGRAFLTDLQGDAEFPGMATGVRVFVSDKDFAHATPAHATRTVDMPITPDGAVQNAVVDGLTNGIPYYFRLSSIDPAGNIFAFQSDQNIQDANFGHCKFPADTDMTDACRYRALPAK